MQQRHPIQSSAAFLEGNLFWHIASTSATSSVGIMLVFLVDLVDMILISMIGIDALAAAIGYAGAILFFTTSVSIGTGIAAGIVTAKAIGARDDLKARELASVSVFVSVAVTSVAAALVWIFIPDLLSLVGASGETHALAASYLRIVVPSLPLLAIAMSIGAILRSRSDARRAMLTTAYGAFVNAALDPILIFGLDMGLDGAVLASVAARATMALSAFYVLWRLHNGLALPHPSRWLVQVRSILALAGPSVMTNVATPFGAGLVTRAMAEFGEAAVAGMAVITRITPFAFVLVFAISASVGPIIGQNLGARNLPRVSKTVTDALLFLGLYTLVVSFALYLGRPAIANVFSVEGEARALGRRLINA